MLLSFNPSNENKDREMHKIHEMLPQQNLYLMVKLLEIYYDNYVSPFINRVDIYIMFIYSYIFTFFQYMIMQEKQLLTRTLNRF